MFFFFKQKTANEVGTGDGSSDVCSSDLSDMQYQRTDIEWKRGLCRARGDAIEVWPAYERYAVRIELFGDEIERVDLINPTSGEVIAEERHFFLFPNDVGNGSTAASANVKSKALAYLLRSMRAAHALE